MKKSLLGILLMAIVIAAPITAKAGVRVGVNIGIPPIVIGVGGPPDLVEVPYAAGVYVAPDVNVDLFFWNGWWWRPYGGHWYRSRYYDRGWGYYNRVPRFYQRVDPAWRGYYRAHNWHGRPWNYERIPGSRFQRH